MDSLCIAGVLKASLATSLGGKLLGFRFPIGVCTYKDGLIVCNSGDNSVVFFRYSDDGSVSDKFVLQVSYYRILNILNLWLVPISWAV